MAFSGDGSNTQIASISIGSSLDLSGLYKGIKQLDRINIPELHLKPTVDFKPLHDLNKLFDEKDRHKKRINQNWKRDPLKPIVDFRDIKGLGKELDAANQEWQDFRREFTRPIAPKIDLRGLDAVEKRIGELERRSINIRVSGRVDGGGGSRSGGSDQFSKTLAQDIGREVAKNVSKGNAGGALKSIAMAPLKLAGNAFSKVAEGITYGVTQEVSKGLGQGLSSAIERSLSQSVGSSELLGDKLGGVIIETVSSRISKGSAAIPKALDEAIANANIDRKLKQRLQSVSEALKGFSKQSRESFFETLGADNILQEGLYQRGMQQRSSARRAPIAREQSTQEWRRSLERRDRIESRGAVRIAENRQQMQELMPSIQEAQQEFQRANEAFKEIDENTSQAQADELAQNLKQASARVQGLTESYRQLQEYEAFVQRATKEARESVKQSYGRVQQIAPVAKGPQSYLDLAKQTLGDVSESKIPQLRVADRSLKKAGALSQYDPARNAIEITRETYEAIKKNTLTPQQAEMLKEELEHAADFDFGSFQGIQAAQRNRIVRQQITPTTEELQRFLPELGLYRPERRSLELNAKVRAARGMPAYEQEQSLQRQLGDVATLASNKKVIETRRLAFNDLIKQLEVFAKEAGNDVTQAVQVYEQAFGKAEGEVNALLDNMLQSAAALDQDAIADVAGEISKLFAGRLQIIDDKLREAIAKQIDAVAAVRRGDIPPEAAAGAIVRGGGKPPTGGQSAKTTQEKIAQAATEASKVVTTGMRSAGQGIKAAAEVVQEALSSAPAKEFAYNLGQATRAAYEMGKVAYKITEGLESIALDMIPMGRTIKGVTQQTVIPAAMFGAATHMLPGGQMAAEGLTHLAQGAISPLVHGASGALSQSATEIIQQVVPKMFGMQGNAIGAATGAIEAATGAIGGLAAQAGAAVLGGKMLQTAGSLPLKAVSTPEPQQVPLLIAQQREKELLALPANQESAIVRRQSKKAIVRSEDQAKREMAKEAAYKAGQVTRDVVDNVSNTAQSAIEEAKKIEASFTKLYNSLKTAIKDNNSALVNIYGQGLEEFSNQNKEAIDKLIQQAKQAGSKAFGSQDLTTLGGIKGRLTSRQNNARRSLQKYQRSQQESGEDLSAQSIDPRITAQAQAALQVIRVTAQQSIEALNQITAKLAEVEAQPTLGGTLKSAAKSERGKDLIVNTGGFIASSAAQPYGPVAELAADLIGAMATRQAVEFGEVGKRSISKLQQDETYKAAKALQKFSMLLNEVNQQIQSKEFARTQSSALFGDLTGFTIGNLVKELPNMAAGVAGMDALGGVPGRGAIVAMQAVPQLQKLREAILRQLTSDIDDVTSGENLKAQALKFNRSGLNPDDTPDDDQKLFLQQVLALLDDAIAKANQFDDAFKKVKETGYQGPQPVNPEALQALENQVTADPQLNLNYSGVNARPENAAHAEYLKHVKELLLDAEAAADRFDAAFRKLDAPSLQALQESLESANQAFDEDGKAIIEEVQREIANYEAIVKELDEGYAQRSAAAAEKLKEQVEYRRAYAEMMGVDPDSAEGMAGLDISMPKDPGALSQYFEAITGDASDLLNTLGGIPGVTKKAVAGLLGFTAAQFLIPLFQEISAGSLQAAREFEQFERTLAFVTGSATTAKETLAALRDESNRLGIDARGAIAGQTQLMAATRGTSLEGAATEQIGAATRQASSVYGLTPEQFDRVNLAITQMASKGKVSAEELRQQLGEVLPGAFQIMARAIGVTTQQLDAMLMRGEVGTDSLIRFAAQLSAETSTGVAGAANSSQAALNRFNNTVYELQVALGQKLLPAQNLGLETLTQALGILEAMLPAISVAIGVFSLKLSMSLGGAALNAVTGMVSLQGSLLALPGVLGKAVSALAPFAAQMLVFAALGDAFTTYRKMTDDAAKASRNFANTATEGLQKYLELTGEATNETKKLADQLKKLPESYAESTLLGGGITKALLGEERGTQYLREREQDIGRGGSAGTAGDILRLFGVRSEGQTTENLTFAPYSEKRGQDIAAANNQGATAFNTLLDRLNTQLDRYQQGGGQLQQVRSLDIQMRDLQSQRALISPNDTAARRQIDQRYESLLKEREKVATEVTTLQSEITTQVEALEAANKEIAEALSQGGLSPATQKRLQKELDRNNELIEEGRVGLEGYAKAINIAVDSSAKLQAQFEAITGAIEIGGTQIQTEFAKYQRELSRTQASGLLTPGQAQASGDRLQQRELDATIGNLTTGINQISELLNSPAISRALTSAGLDSSVDALTLNNRLAAMQAEGVDPDSEEFKTLTGAQQQIRERDQLQLQVEQARTQQQQAATQAQESMRDASKQVQEFFRQTTRSTQEFQRSIESLNLSQQLNEAKLDLRNSINGFTGRFFGFLGDTLSSLLDQLYEPDRIMLDAQGQVANLQNQLQDQRLGATQTQRGIYGGSTVPFQDVIVTSAVDASGEPGLDYVVSGGERGAQFGALAGGQVIEVKRDDRELGMGGERGYGNQVIVRSVDEATGEIVDMLYAHLDDIMVEVGQQVGVGTALGTQGRTGSTTGAHVSVDFFGKDSSGTTPAALAMRDRIASALANNPDSLNALIQSPVGQAIGGGLTSAPSASTSTISAGMFGGVQLNEEQVRNAAIIAKVGAELGASPRDIQIALATAMQESTLQNLDYGDADSIGLFQQRPSMDWGSVEQIMNPEYSARAFFEGAGTNPGLFSISDRNSLGVAEAAQAVQRSAFPDAYAQWEAMSGELANRFFGGGQSGTGMVNTAPITQSTAAYQQTGQRYGQSILSEAASRSAIAQQEIQRSIEQAQQQLESSGEQLSDQVLQGRRQVEDLFLQPLQNTEFGQRYSEQIQLQRQADDQSEESRRLMRDLGRDIAGLEGALEATQIDPRLADLVTPISDELAKAQVALAELETQAQQYDQATQRAQTAIDLQARRAIEREEETMRQRTRQLQAQSFVSGIRTPELQSIAQSSLDVSQIYQSYQEQEIPIAEQIQDLTRNLEEAQKRADELGIEPDPQFVEDVNTELDRLRTNLEAIRDQRDIEVDIRLNERDRAIDDYFRGQQESIVQGQAQILQNRGDVFGANQLQREFATQQQGMQYQQQLQGVESLFSSGQITADEAAQAYSNLSQLNNISLEGLRSQFTDLGDSINQIAIDGFGSLTQGISDVILNGGKLTDLFDQVSKQIINSLLQIGTQFLQSQLYGLFFPQQGGAGGGGLGGLFGSLIGGTSQLAGASFGSSGISAGGLGAAAGGGGGLGGFAGTAMSIIGAFAGMNTGGPIGSGYGGGDKWPILGESGEFMIRKEAVAALGGLPAMEVLNNAHKMPKFAVGGPIGSLPAIPKPPSVPRSPVAPSMPQYRPDPSRYDNAPREVTLKTQVINNVEYATVDDVRAAYTNARKDGARDGRDLAFQAMQSSPNARRGIGI